MSKPYPAEFRDDVVAVARKREDPLKQIAKDFGISESCLSTWLKKANVEDGSHPGVTDQQAAEVRTLQEAQATAGAGERGPAPSSGVSVTGKPAGKIVFPLVREMATTGARIRGGVAGC